MTTCMNHHNACDCREAEFAAMQRELLLERERADYAWRNTRAIEAHYTAADNNQREEIGRLRDALAWPIKGVRVEDDKVIIAVKGGNDAARWLCGEILSAHSVTPDTQQSETAKGEAK